MLGCHVAHRLTDPLEQENERIGTALLRGPVLVDAGGHGFCVTEQQLRLSPVHGPQQRPVHRHGAAHSSRSGRRNVEVQHRQLGSEVSATLTEHHNISHSAGS